MSREFVVISRLIAVAMIALLARDAIGSVTPTRSSVRAFSNIKLTGVNQIDESDLIADQQGMLDQLGPIVATSTIDTAQGFYSAMTTTTAGFIDTHNGVYEAIQSYSGARGSGVITAQLYQHTLEGVMDYEFTIPDEGSVRINGTLFNHGPSSLNYFAVVQVFSESVVGGGFTGPFFEQPIRDFELDSERFNFDIPLTAQTGSYRIRIRLAHSGLGQLDAPLSSGSLLATWSIDAPDPCVADLNNDDELDFLDVSAFISAFVIQQPLADLNGDGEYDFLDISAFLGSYSSGCV